MFKKLTIAFTIVTSLTAFTPKAEAGLIVGTIFGDPGKGATIGAVVGVAASVGIEIALMNDPMSQVFFIMAIPPVIGMGCLLDVDAALPDNELMSALQKKYPFIDNAEALANLAATVKSKLSDRISLETSTFISLSHEEVAVALETADISQEQFEQIVTDLK